MHGAGQADLEIEDLVQTGLVALTECISRHEHDSEDGFAAYAKVRVKGAMIDLLRRNATITRGAMARRREINDTEKTLLNRFGRPPTSAELAATLGISEDELDAARLAATPLRFEPLEECYSDSDSAFVDETPNGLELLCDVEARAHLANAIHALGERSQLVVQLYFLEEFNLAEIAQILGVSVPRVHQLKANALSELKKRLDEIELDFDLVGSTA
jgi:RNA polymerase sigma factor for flagellar operon FliA